MSTAETALTIDRAGRSLVGILHRPLQPSVDTGVVVIVGGPQYRVGSHRQFTLLARALCNQGIPVLRFDYTGMGDSDGDPVAFDSIDADVRVAIDTIYSRCPALRGVHLWGLCDGASAAMLYAPTDSRVTGLILLNPWVRTEQGEAKAFIENYYGRRLRSGALWKKLARDPMALVRAATGFVRNLAISRGSASADSATRHRAPGFVERMQAAMERYPGRVLVLLSGVDRVATEFELLLAGSAGWQRAFRRPGVESDRLPAANHTFSRREWSDWVVAKTVGFVKCDGPVSGHLNCDSVGDLDRERMRD